MEQYAVANSSVNTNMVICESQNDKCKLSITI